MQRALVAGFDTPAAVVRAARELRARGHRQIDAFTPYPMLELEEALALPRSPLGWLVFPLALCGAGTAYLIQWWTSAVDYPLNVGARPPHAAPAFVPITFEMGVLAASTTALIALFVVARLTALYRPIFAVPGFERATIDRFFLEIDATDPAFEPEATIRALDELGAVSVAWVGEAPS